MFSLGTLRLFNLGMGNVLILSCIMTLRAHDNRIMVVLQPEIKCLGMHTTHLSACLRRN